MALFCLLVLPRIGWSQESSSRAADEAAIRQVVANFSDGGNRHDTRAMSADLAEEGDFVI